MDSFGHRHGPHVLWRSEDGDTCILRHCAGVYTLEHRGVEVFAPCSYSKAYKYAVAEFIPIPEPA